MSTSSGSASLPERSSFGAPSFASFSVQSTRDGRRRGHVQDQAAAQYAAPSPSTTASGPLANRGSATGAAAVFLATGRARAHRPRTGAAGLAAGRRAMWAHAGGELTDGCSPSAESEGDSGPGKRAAEAVEKN